MIDLNEIVQKEDAIKKPFKLGEETYYLKPMTKERTDSFMALGARVKRQSEEGDQISLHEVVAEQLNLLLGVAPEVVYSWSLSTAKDILQVVLKEAGLAGELKDGTLK